MKLVIVAFGIIAMLLSLQFLPKKELTYSDRQLQQMALDGNLKPAPKTLEDIIKLTDNPNNPLTLEKIALGKKLFNDPILSLNQDIACASCHLLENGGDDDKPTAIGHKNQANPFHLNSPTVLNAALAKAQFWDGRAKDVEEQAAGPMQAPFEMSITPKEVENRLNSHEGYKKAFDKEYITFLDVQNAVGAYERTLLTRGNFDLFLEGDMNALSQKAKKGLELFLTKGCKGCHTGMSVGGQSMQKFPLRPREFDIFPRIDFSVKSDDFPFENVGGFLGKDDNQIFRVPILRNISKTAPYFHNGAVKELKDAVNIMGKYQLGINFSDEELDALVEFLKSLDGEIVDSASSNHVRWQAEFEKALCLAKESSKPLMLLILNKDETSIISSLFQNKPYVDIINKSFIPIVAMFEHKNSYPIEMFYTTTLPALFFISSADESQIAEPIIGKITQEDIQNRVLKFK